MKIRCAIAACVLYLFSAPLPSFADEADAIRDTLLGRTAIFKIEMPVVKGSN